MRSVERFVAVLAVMGFAFIAFGSFMLGEMTWGLIASACALLGLIYDELKEMNDGKR